MRNGHVTRVLGAAPKRNASRNLTWRSTTTRAFLRICLLSMNFHHIPQDLYQNPLQDPQDPSRPLNSQHVQEQIQQPPSAGSASPWDASLIEPLDEDQFVQMTLLLQHQQGHQQQQAQVNQSMAAGGFVAASPMQPPIATLSPDYASSVYAPSPLSASTSAPSPGQSQTYEPPQVIQLVERPQRRTRRQQDATNAKTTQQQAESQNQFQQTPSVPAGVAPQEVHMKRAKPPSAGSRLEANRTTVRPLAPPLPSNRSGGQLGLNTPDPGAAFVQGVSGSRGSARPSSARAQVRAHPYRQQGRRTVSGPVPTINTSVSGGSLANRCVCH